MIHVAMRAQDVREEQALTWLQDATQSRARLVLQRCNDPFGIARVNASYWDNAVSILYLL